MMRALLAATLVAALFAGCAGSKDSAPHELTPTEVANLRLPGNAHLGLAAGPALWDDPQNAPHPKWDWPTLSHPAVNGTIPDGWAPIAARPLPSTIAGVEHLAHAEKVPEGNGIAIFGHLVVVPGEGAGNTTIVDISDPAHPVAIGSVEEPGRGAAIIAYPDGRLAAAISTSPGFDVVDLTDPRAPSVIASVKPSEGGHKLGIVPGTPILYNAGSNGGESTTPLLGPGPCNADVSMCTGYTSIYNLTDPANPVLVQEFQNGLSCHHIFFWNNAKESKYRAICAGIQYTQIWDTADPEHPKVIVSVPVHTGAANGPSNSLSIFMFSHSAGLNTKGDILYVGDENMGGGSPPGCIAGTETPEGNAGTPIGATWFYDISTETNPKLLGYFSPPRDASHNTSRSCTTHHGRIVPDPHRDLLAMSYYQDGTFLIDFTPVMGENGPAIVPKVVGEWGASDGADVWETWYDQGYLFTGDIARGLDVLTFT